MLRMVILLKNIHVNTEFYTNKWNSNNLKNAFISAEDKKFYNHIGIDPLGIIRAALKNTINIFNNRRPEGASTITQQVAKNFYCQMN